MGRKASFVALIILTMIVAPPSAFFVFVGIVGTIDPMSIIPGPLYLIPALISLISLAGLWWWWYKFDFKGFRRTAGVVTLGLACAEMALSLQQCAIVAEIAATFPGSGGSFSFVPYVVRALPLALLSAYLLLWPGKRRDRQVNAPTDPPSPN